MPRLFILRHGETEGNERKIFRGRWDLSLSDRGVEQVALAAKALAGIEFSMIATSLLARARETAAAAASHGGRSEITLEEKLIDIDYGRWTKEPSETVDRDYPDLSNAWRNTPHKVVFPGGESLSDVRSRAEELFRSLAGATGNVLLVSHRVPIKVMLCAALGLDNSAFWRIKVDTTSISVVELAPQTQPHERAQLQTQVLLLNDTSHLGPLNTRFTAADF